MSGIITELIPFKVEVMPFEELMSAEEWVLVERDVRNVIRADFLQRLWGSYQFSERVDELRKKMMPNPVRTASWEAYIVWTEHFPGEWIVVGKIGQYYLAAQPKKMLQMLPMECCRFIGLM